MGKKIGVISVLLVLAAAFAGRAADLAEDYAVQVSAKVRVAPPEITLSWPQDSSAPPASYTVYRKAPADTSWGAGVTLPGANAVYVDTNVSVGTAYEYQIVKHTGPCTGYGYLYAGIAVPMADSRGKLLLMVDNTFSAVLAPELLRLQQDLVGDGWSVIPLEVSRADSPVNVKRMIQAQYNADPANVKCVFLFGH